MITLMTMAVGGFTLNLLGVGHPIPIAVGVVYAVGAGVVASCIIYGTVDGFLTRRRLRARARAARQQTGY
jgi:hypothetical protein